MDESYHLDNGPGLCKMKRVIGYALNQSATTCAAVRANDPRIEVETALALDRAPRIQTYIALKRKLKCDDEWLSEFLHNHGLGILFKSLDKSRRQKCGRFYCVVLRIVIIQCIRAVMSSQTSLDYIIENEDFIRKFSTGKHISQNTGENLTTATVVREFAPHMSPASLTALSQLVMFTGSRRQVTRNFAFKCGFNHQCVV